jgi:hypothetical protein
MVSMTDAVRRVKGDPSAWIDPGVVAAACAGASHRWRDRVFNPLRTLEAFAVQIAHGNTAMAHLVRLLGGGFSESAYCQARQRLPVEVLRAVLDACTARLFGAARGEAGTWRGHRTFIADGTGCDMPDTPDLQGHFGQTSRQRQGCGFPLAHVLTLFDAGSGLLLDTTVSPYGATDLRTMHRLHPRLDAGDLLIADRGFCGYCHTAALLERGIQSLFRSHAGRVIPFPAQTGPRERHTYNRHRRKTPILIELIGPDDQIVELVKPSNRAPWMSPEQFARVPAVLRVRVLRYRVQEPGFRTRHVELMTTLLDARKYPAAELAELYLARWRVEVSLRHLKQTLGMTSLHCKTVDGVSKEILMYALVYNAVCAVMGMAAQRQAVPVQRLSFIDALRWLTTHGPDDPPPVIKINPRRTGRLFARYVKRGTRFPRLKVPRQLWKERYLAKHAN